MAGSRWILESARAILPDVRDRTARAVSEVDRLEERRRLRKGNARVDLEEQIQAEMSRWIREMEALGVTVRGVWRVDFDTGKGSFCWRWPEDKLEWFQGSEDGFRERFRIQ